MIYAMKVGISVAVVAVCGLLVRAADPIVVDDPRNVSEAVEKDGLQLSVSVPAKITTAGPFSFEANLKNVGKGDLKLADPQWDTRSWKVDVIPEGAPLGWRLRFPVKVAAKDVMEMKVLKPQEALTVKVDAAEGEFAWVGEQEQPRRPVKQLPEGKYSLVIEAKLSSPEVLRNATPIWSGTIKSKPVSFKVVPAEAK